MNVPQSIKDKLYKFDSRLRIRWGNYRGCFLVEQRHRNKQILNPKKFKDIDAYICARDGYIHVMNVAYFNLNKLVDVLRQNAIWRWQTRYEPGFKAIERELDNHRDQLEKERLSKQNNLLNDLGSEAFDAIAWKERRRVSMHISDNVVVNDNRRVFV